MKRTIDDRDGNPVEIEIDAEPQLVAMTLDDVIQALLLARQIMKGEVKQPPIMPGYEHRYKRKKGKR